MDIPSPGKSSTMSFRYNANNEELEELFQVCDDDPPTPQCESSQSSVQSESASPKKLDKTSSLIDKYFKSMRTEKPIEKIEDVKSTENKLTDEPRSNTPKDVTSSPMKEYLNRLSKKSNVLEVNSELKEGNNETWKIFHDFRFKIAQAVEDIKTRSTEDTKEKSVPRENSTSDSEENSVLKDSDQQSVGDTDNQVSSLDSSIQNLSEVTPLTTKAMENATNASDNKQSDSSDDTHKNIVNNEAEGAKYLIDDNNAEDVESGVEALEDTNINTFSDIANIVPIEGNENPEDMRISLPPTPKNFGIPPINNNIKTSEPHNFFNFPILFFTFLLLFNYIFFSNSSIWNGFVMGIWFYSFTNNVKAWVLDRYFSDRHPEELEVFQSRRSTMLNNSYTIPSVKEHRPLKKYEGWINHYRFPNYDPSTYHINKTTTAFIKLEGCNLRLSYTKTKIPKRALWDEKIENVAFYQHRFYNLTGARVILLPRGLVNKRQWSKKYPICVVLNEKDVIQVLERESISFEKRMSEDKKSKEQQVQHDVETTETNTSPEKKKKFIWRKREKSISHTEAEPGKEGLRHRLVRKIHREKKSDSVSEPIEGPSEVKLEKTIPTESVCRETDADLPRGVSFQDAKEDPVDEDLDDNDLSKIKDFLEETDLEAEGVMDSEWSMHVKHSKDHSHIYLFARTSRDKHDWFRRLRNAVLEANANSAESSSAEDKSFDPVIEPRESIDVSTVAFAKTSNRADSTSEGVTIMTASSAAPTDYELYEKNFWSYFFKIVQSKIPISSVASQSYILPAEVAWLNTVLARLFYDVMRDPQIIARLQTRIQKKVHTLKLPSFMSPLVVTELSLAGACPLVERMSAPSWDERGVWLDADLRYDGGGYISILTQINLMKLKEKNLLDEQLLSGSLNLIETEIDATSSRELSESQLRRSKPAIFDSDVEDSAESSSDEDSPNVQPVESHETAPLVVPDSPPAAEGGSSKKKFLRIVDKIATNKYFQQVTDYKYVKRAMEGLSNTDIKLQVEVQGFEGRLAINLPPPPHDRVWLGFRTNPHLVLKARPAFGARSVRITQITNWIEQKLIKEFEKVLVLPNMEDLVIDFMTPTPVVFE